MHIWSGWQPPWDVMNAILSERYQTILLSGHLGPVIMETLELSGLCEPVLFLL